MKHVRLRITADGREDEVSTVYDFLANDPSIEYATAINWSFAGDELGFLHYVEGDRDAFESTLQSIPEMVDYEITPTSDGEFYAFIRGETTRVLREVWELTTNRGLVPIPPIEYHPDGAMTISLFGPSEDLQTALEGFPDPLSVTVEEISGLQALPQTVTSVLSDRQREAVEAAIDVGYYDVPRTGNQEDVAEAMGCAPSTAAEHLRKAESRVLRSLFA